MPFTHINRLEFGKIVINEIQCVYLINWLCNSLFVFRMFSLHGLCMVYVFSGLRTSFEVFVCMFNVFCLRVFICCVVLSLHVCFEYVSVSVFIFNACFCVWKQHLYVCTLHLQRRQEFCWISFMCYYTSMAFWLNRRIPILENTGSCTAEHNSSRWI